MTISQQPLFNNWNISLQGGGKLLSMGQRITLDAVHYIALFQHQIKVYYLATRQCIKTIPIDLTSATIIDSLVLEHNPNLVYLFDRSGKVFVVNWKEKPGHQALVDTLQLQSLDSSNNSILRILAFDPATHSTLAISGKYSSTSLLPRAVHITRHSAGSVETLLSIKNVVLFKSSINRANIIFLNNNSEIISVALKDSEIHRTQTISFVFKSKVTSIAVSNNAEIIALGTASGIVQLIYGNNLDKPQRLLKWHIDQVRALEFNHDDSYLLSGGIEKVLVFWQLDTDRQQFLPRLNGVIDNIVIDPHVPELYSVTLNLNEANDIELLLLNASDLISRLTVNGLRPNFNTAPNFAKLRKRLDGTVLELKNDFTCSAAVNPLTGHLYLPMGSNIQVYDFKKDEQLFIQTAVATTQVGKVKSEQQILDPKIEIIKFSHDGKWMCTFDSVPTPSLDNLLSTKDVHYSLKFWKLQESAKDPKQSHWELSTKIIDPHGVKTPIVSIISAPSSYHNGLLFLTADTKGGIRLWRPRIPKEIYNKVAVANNEKLQQTAWMLKKSYVGNGTFETNSVSLSWSLDASIIVIGYENSLNLLDCNTFREVEDFHLPSLLGSRVRAVHIVDNQVVALAKNRIVSYDLLNAKNGVLCGRVQSPTNGKNLITVNYAKGLIALVVNFFNKTHELAKIFIFKPDLLKPVYIGHHSLYISCIEYAASLNSFVFVDLDSRVGVVSSTIQEDLPQLEESNYAYQLNMLLNNVQLQLQETANGQDKGDDVEMIAEEGLIVYGKSLNAHSFDRILENTESVLLESLFERIMNVL